MNISESLLIISSQLKQNCIDENKLAFVIYHNILRAHSLMLVLEMIQKVQSPHYVVNHPQYFNLLVIYVAYFTLERLQGINHSVVVQF